MRGIEKLIPGTALRGLEKLITPSLSSLIVSHFCPKSAKKQEGFSTCSFRINMYELMIVRNIGELIDH